MAVPRLLSRGRCLLSRGTCTPSIRIAPSPISIVRAPMSGRKFSSGVPVWEDIVQTPSRGPEITLTDARVAPTGSHAQSIALLRLPKRATRLEIEELLRSKGYKIKKFHMRLDRFTFHNDTKCYVELGSEEEAAKAVAQLHNVELQGKNIVVTPLKADFQWGAVADKSGSPYGSPFYDENNGAEGALRPLIERRRIMLQVQTPGWTTDLVNKQTKNALRIIEQTFDMYGVEKVGPIHPFYGDKKQKPRLLCFMDFKTKEGADEAIRNHHNTMIEGRLTWLTLSTPVSYRTHHIQKVAPKLVADLQEQGLLPKETREDKFINPMPRNESK